MTPTTDESVEHSPSIEIDLLGMVRRRWGHVFLGLGIGVALAAMYLFSTTPMYESEVEILVGQRSSEVTNNGTITGASASGDSIHEDQLATHMRLFVGRTLISDAIKVGELDQLQSFRAASKNGTNLIDHILAHIDVQRGGEGSARDAMVLRATFRDPCPDDAAVVLASIYESYRSYVEAHGQNSTKQAVKLIEEARETHEKELEQVDREYREFVRSVPVLTDGDRVQDVHKVRLANMESELNLVRSQLAESSSRLEVINHYLDNHASESVDQMDHLALLSQKETERLKLFLDVTRGEAQSEAFQAEQPMRQEVAKAQYNRLLDLIQKEKSFSDAFGPGHPLVEAVRQETAITRQFIEANTPDETQQPSKKLDAADMLNTYTMLLRNDIAELEKRKQLLLSESAHELMLAKQVESDFMRGNSLRAKLARAQSRYDEVILRLQELNLARSYAGFSTDVLANPEPSQSAAWPSVPIVSALGLFFGLAMGLTFAVAAELADSTFTSVHDLEKSVGSQAIAHVPRFDTKRLMLESEVESELDPSLIAFHAPRSAESEVYRVARTSLMIANRKGAVQTMMMTSPQPGDGKSTTISNLAISFAKAGKRVLLIDADLRRPMISNLFGLEAGVGLADALEGEASLAQATVASEVPSLDIMPHGKPTSVPAELLESRQMRKLLQQARSEYDLVLVDAPPLLAVADPAIVAPIVDKVILTVRIQKNGRRPVEHAARVLQDIDVQAAAVIVNGVDKKRKGSYGYGNTEQGEYGYVGHYHDRYSAVDADKVNTTHPKRELSPPHTRPRVKREVASGTTVAPTFGRDGTPPSQSSQLQ